MATMLDNTIKQQVQEVFTELEHPVAILFFGSSDKSVCQYCDETRQLLEEVSELSDLLTLRAYDIDQDGGLAQQYRVDGVPGLSWQGWKESRCWILAFATKAFPRGMNLAL